MNDGSHSQKEGKPSEPDGESVPDDDRLPPLTEEYISGLERTASAKFDKAPANWVRLIRAVAGFLKG